MSKLKLKPINELGPFRQGTLSVSFDEIVETIFPPNLIDDPIKVKASWGFQDEKGRKGFIWCYNYDDPLFCFDWSINGDKKLFNELFGDNFEFDE